MFYVLFIPVGWTKERNVSHSAKVISLQLRSEEEEVGDNYLINY